MQEAKTKSWKITAEGEKEGKKKTTLLTEQQDMAVFSSEAMQARRQGRTPF